MNNKPFALLLVLALGACGKDSGTNPDSTPVTGDYDLVIVPSADCGYPGAPYQIAVVAQQPGQTGGPPSANLRVTLPGADSRLAMDMQYTSATVVRGSIATQQAVEFGSVFALYLRNVGTGTVSAASGGRGEIRDGTMSGEVQVFQNDVDLGICTSTGHRWSLRAR